MQQGDVIQLPAPVTKGGMPLAEAIELRRSSRSYAPASLTLAHLSQILWAGQAFRSTEPGYRTVPSAGATYPLEFYVICGQEGLEDKPEGIYRYAPFSHSLSFLYSGDVREELTSAALDQQSIRQAPVSLVLCAEYERTTDKYRRRGERYVHMEAGHSAQNIYLQTTALGLATVAIGAFNDETVIHVLQLESHYKPLYIMPLGIGQ